MKKKTLILITTFLASIIFLIAINITDSVISLNRVVNGRSKIIFIGDSRTQYQISPYLISKDFGIATLNAGNNGHFYPYWGGIVANQPTTQLIVFGLSVEDFFTAFNDKNIQYFANFLDFFFLAGVVNDNYRFKYLKYAIRHSFKQFPRDFFDVVHHVNKYQDNISAKPHCELETKNKNEIVYRCSGHNDYLLSARYPRNKNKNIDLSDDSLNINVINYFNHLVSYARSHNHAAVVIVLIPSYGMKYHFSYRLLEKKLGVPILDLSDFLIKDGSYWEGSGSHLNQRGSLLFTKHIMEWLSQTFPNLTKRELSKQQFSMNNDEHRKRPPSPFEFAST